MTIERTQCLAELPDLVEIYWEQGEHGHRQVSYAEPKINPDMGRYNRLFETHCDHVRFDGADYVKTTDEAIMYRGQPTVHLKYEKVSPK